MKNSILVSSLVLGIGYLALNCHYLPTGDLTVSQADSSINISWGLDNGSISKDKDFIYLYTEFKGGKMRNNNNRKPLNIALVIDRSGSMGGNKLLYAQKAAHVLVENLQIGDHFSLVDYDDKITTTVPSESIGENRKHIYDAIDNLFARGSTNLCGGMLEGFNQVKKNFEKTHVNRVLLMSDGLANVGVTSNEEIQKIAKSRLEETGISVSSFGIGADFNEVLMTHLAEYGNGIIISLIPRIKFPHNLPLK